MPTPFGTNEKYKKSVFEVLYGVFQRLYYRIVCLIN